MASPIVYLAGLVGSGIDTATVSPDLFSTPVIWLDNSNASASDANAGTEPEKPLSTLAQAVTNASTGAVIAIGSGHAQTISSTVTISKAGLRLVGFGIGTARATFTPSSGATSVISIAAGGNDTVIENIYFKAAAGTSGTGGRVVSAVTGTEILSCQFDCGAFDQEAVLLNTSADNVRIESCVFTAVGATPTRALGLAGTTNTNVKVLSCTFDGSTFGWAGNCVTINNCVRFVSKNNTWTGRADLNGTTTTSYQMFGPVGSSAVRFTVS